MHVNFTPRNDGPERLICEAELHFDQDTDGPLAGLRLVGFSLWRGADDETYVTFPSRAFDRAYERRFFDYLRGDGATVKRFKEAGAGEPWTARPMARKAPRERSE